MRISFATIALSVCLLGANPAFAYITGPYTADTVTLHLWHLDETAVPCADSASSGAVNLKGLLNSATLANSAYSGFGTCLSTLGTAGLGAWSNGTPTSAGLFPTTTFTAATAMAYADPTTGAFTMEALICPLFPVTTNFGSVAHGGTGRTSIQWQILSGESGTTSNRIWQFRFNPIGSVTGGQFPSTGNTAPLLCFANVLEAGPSQPYYAIIPTTGSNAIASNQWFHVAVTYNGSANTAGNLNFYWTAMDPNATSANLILSTTMTNSLASTSSKPSLAIGNTGRSDDGNWLGLIDEVRMSSTPRSASDMMFAPPPVITSYLYNPTTGQLALTWTSTASSTYSVLYSTDLSVGAGGFSSLVSGIPSGGSTTSFIITPPAGPVGFVEIGVDPAP